MPGHGAVCVVDAVLTQAALFDHLREHAERMKHAGATAEEAESTYEPNRRFRSFDVLSWNFTIGGAMRSYFAAAG